MNKCIKLILSVTFVIIMITSFCYAKEMIKAKDTYYLIDDDSSICKNEMFYNGQCAYYFGEDGRMYVGWLRNNKNGKNYFFDNTQSSTRGAMITGMHVIDGFTMFFESDINREAGSLITSVEQYKAPNGKTYRIDTNGYAYDESGNVLRDTEKGHRSEFYTDEAFYINQALDNSNLNGVSSSIGNANVSQKSLAREQLSKQQGKGLIISNKIK